MRFGIIGTGRITRRLVADLQSTPGISVTSLASRDASRANWSAGQYGIAIAIQGYQALLDSDHVDAVYIATPPSTHAALSIAAAKAGKHFICEKPLAMSHDEAIAVADAARDANVRWLDATAWLHHERTHAMRQMVASGMIGSLRHISAAVSFFEPFQDNDHRRDASLGGGCLLDLAWYSAGCAIAVAGPCRALIATEILRDAVAFRVNAMLQFDDDVTAGINCGYDTATRKWMEWAGDQASIICDDFTRPWPDRPPRIWVHDRAGSVTSRQYTGSQERSMIECLISDTDLGPLHQQAMRTQATLDAMMRSIKTKQWESIQCE